MNEYSLRLENVTKHFKIRKFDSKKKDFALQQIKSLDSVSITIPHGTVVGVIGKNGSGKTTLLRIMAGILRPDKGEIDVKGSIGPLLQVGVGSNDENTVKENIILNGLLLGFKKKWIQERVTNILDFAELQDYQEAKMKTLSTGMKSRVMFSTALLLDPKVLLVDEVVSVGDLAFRKKSFDAFKEFKKKERTVVIVSHNMSLLRKLCDQVLWLDNGRIVEHGIPEKVIDSYITTKGFHNS